MDQRLRTVGLGLLLLLLVSCGAPTPLPQMEQTASPEPQTRIYALTDQAVNALNTQTGTPLWTFDVELPIAESLSYEPLLKAKRQVTTLQEDSLYIAGKDALYALNALKGDERWKQPLSIEQGGLTYQPRLFATDKLVLVAIEDLIHAFDAQTGALVWRAEKSTFLAHSGNIVIARTWDVVEEERVLVGMDIQTGKELWRRLAGDFWPASVQFQWAEIADQSVLLIFREAVVALDATTGTVQWVLGEEQLKAETTPTIWEACVVGPTLYLVGQLGEHAVAAYTIADGKQTWALSPQEFPHRTGWGTSVSSAHDVLFSQKGMFMLVGPSHGDIEARNMQDGKVHWTLPGSGSFDMIHVEQGTVYAGNAHTAEMTAIRLADQKVLWTTHGNEHFVIHKNVPYVTGKENTSMFSALDPDTGKPQWSTRLKGHTLHMLIA